MSCFYSYKCRDSVTFCQEIYSRRGEPRTRAKRYESLNLAKWWAYSEVSEGEASALFTAEEKEVKKKKKEEMKRQKQTVRMWQQSSNLETLGGRERSLRGLYVSEGDHRPIAAQWQEPPPGDKGTCDFNSLLLCVSEGTAPACHHPHCAKNTAEHGFWGSLLNILILACHTAACDTSVWLPKMCCERDSLPHWGT